MTSRHLEAAKNYRLMRAGDMSAYPLEGRSNLPDDLFLLADLGAEMVLHPQQQADAMLRDARQEQHAN